MANKPQNDASLQSTKQMLDELDALMEKMLTLPVNDLDDPPGVAPVSKEPAMSATLTLLEPPSAPMPQAAPSPPMSKKPASVPSYQIPEAPEVEAPPPMPVNPPHFEMPPSEPAPRYELPEPLTNEVMPTSALSKVEPLLNEIAEPEAALETQWVYLPLVWLNQGFDQTTLMLGGAGSWMRTQGGRMLLGFTGVLLTFAAVGWFLKDWLGWNW